LGRVDHNWPGYLQETLRKHSNRFVVINAGVYGYSSFQGLRRLEEALSLQPDIVLVSFGWNDSLNVTMSDVDFARKKIRSLKLDRILLKLRIGQLLLAFSDSIFYRGEHHLVPRVSLAEYESNLMKMIQLAKNNDAEIVLITRPSQKDVPTPYDSVAIRVAKKTAVPVVDAYALFKGKHEYFYDENHFNEAGHRLMAKILYDRIEPLFVFSQ
jgi:lysophospholipase L1-like esterase